jgi:hypothetical protein
MNLNTGNMAVKLLLGSIIIFLAYLIYQDMLRPSRFKKEAAAREETVLARMNDLKEAQELFYHKYQHYNSNYDSLYQVIKRDSLFQKRPGLNLDSLKFIPFSAGIKFDLKYPDPDTSGNESVELEIRAPYSAFLKGLNRQFVGFMISDKKARSLYPGIIVQLSVIKEHGS